MDDIKDTQRTDNISRFLDTYQVRTNPFGENRAADRAYRRSERMVSALYLLTNHIPASEDARSSLRSHANELLEHVLSLKDDMRSSQSMAVQSVISNIRHLISLVRVLTIAGYISIANAETMVAALDDLGNFLLTSQRSILSENITIHRDELMDIRETRPRAVQHVKDSREVSVITDSQLVTDRGMSAAVRGASDTLSVRVQNILDILRTGGNLGIKDIVANLPEYSEKMIQRELLTLVRDGRVKKTGLKRWSRYSVTT